MVVMREPIQIAFRSPTGSRRGDRVVTSLEDVHGVELQKPDSVESGPVPTERRGCGTNDSLGIQRDCSGGPNTDRFRHIASVVRSRA